MMAMETSSPLAALQPSNLHWNHTRNAPEFDNGFLRPCRPARDFNFKDMSMRKSNSDYFSYKPIRGSSPTQSLAVDLSQNFHIDRSPPLPTPRRSLFSTTLIRSRPGDVTTPPILSSSPVRHDEHMDCSPLPHKLPVQFSIQEIPLCTPSPEPTPIEETPRLSLQLQRPDSQPEQTSRPVKLPEDRKHFNPPRPGIRKGFSSNNIPLRRPRTADSSRPFMFGALSKIAKPCLESFAESPPPSERKLLPSQSNPSLIAESTSIPFNGSPIAALPRRPPMGRHRSSMTRRTLSVQYSDAKTAMRAEKRCCTTGSIQPGLLLREEHTLKLPHFRPSDDAAGLPRITKETMLDVIDGKYLSDIGDAAIIDCRFEYEFKGGHIKDALNCNDKDEMVRKLFDENAIGNKALILHCEFSHFRAPNMAKYIRERDRAVNQDHYPRLNYPQVYILDGGFHGFFHSHEHLCLGRYVEMEDKQHQAACEKGMAAVKSKRRQLGRSHTYAGQTHSSFQDSPVPAIPTGFPNSLSITDAMDIDSSSPVDVRFAVGSPLAPSFLRFGPKRGDSF